MSEMTNEALLDDYDKWRDCEDSLFYPSPAEREAAERRVADARAAVMARMVSAGWKAVPMEPTDAMKRASRLTQELAPNGGRITVWGCNAWTAMLDAAPTPASP